MKSRKLIVGCVVAFFPSIAAAACGEWESFGGGYSDISRRWCTGERFEYEGGRHRYIVELRNDSGSRVDIDCRIQTDDGTKTIMASLNPGESGSDSMIVKQVGQSRCSIRRR